MSVASTSTSGMVRVTVASGTRRVDLVLPGAVPVAEIVPELARSVGLLDAATVSGGYRVLTGDGRELEPDAGLVIQGVEDGGLLTVFAGADRIPPTVYDDVVEAMADVVEADLASWSPASGRVLAVGAAALLLTLAALGLLPAAESLGAGLAAAGLAVLLLTTAVVHSRVRDEPVAAVILAGAAGVVAVVSGLILAPVELSGDPSSEDRLATPLIWAGSGLLVIGCLAVVGLSTGRGLLLPAVVVGVMALVIGLVAELTEASVAVLGLGVATVAVLWGGVLPWLAVALGLVGADRVGSEVPVAIERVRSDARTAHEILLGMTVALGLTVTLVAPLAVGQGVAGTVLMVVCAVVLALRTRRYRVASEVAAGWCGALVAGSAVAVSVLLTRPEWRVGTVVVLTVIGGVMWASTFLPALTSGLRHRIGDLLEGAALISLLPLAVLATGLAERVAG